MRLISTGAPEDRSYGSSMHFLSARSWIRKQRRRFGVIVERAIAVTRRSEWLKQPGCVVSNTAAASTWFLFSFSPLVPGCTGTVCKL